MRLNDDSPCIRAYKHTLKQMNSFMSNHKRREEFFVTTNIYENLSDARQYKKVFVSNSILQATLQLTLDIVKGVLKGGDKPDYGLIHEFAEDGVCIMSKDACYFVKSTTGQIFFIGLEYKGVNTANEEYLQIEAVYQKVDGTICGDSDESENRRFEFVMMILFYLSFGEITEKHLHHSDKIKVDLTTYIQNRTGMKDIYFANTAWKQRISTDGFPVSGHFRLQPVGEGRQERKLIWIESYAKEGYNRRAGVEIYEDGKK